MNQEKNKFIQEILKDTNKAVHFVGLGGIGMSGLAKFLLGLGYKISGSDIKESLITSSISALGGTIFIGHSANNVENASVVVASTAIKNSNPEILEASIRNIPVVHRSQILEMLMSGFGRDKKPISIGIAGTHGKTTTTGMISLLFEDAQLDPSFIVGGMMPYLKTNSKLGNGGHFIAELDESDGTIKFYSPDISIITNLEFDHPEHYKDGLEQLIKTFENYINNLDPESKIIINADCAGNKQLLKKVNHPGIILYSIDKENEFYNKALYRIEDVNINGLSTSAKIFREKELIGNLILNVPGIYNASNALAAIATGLECGIEFEKIVHSLCRFSGMKRRFQVLGPLNGALIIDDYAHHPTEIQATLKAAKNIVKYNKAGRVIAIFQPHRYSRLASLWNDFVNSFSDADMVYICDVYSAGENPIEGISSKKLSEEIICKNVCYLSGTIEDAVNFMENKIKPNDLVLSMGAGDITRFGALLFKKADGAAK